MMYKLMNKIMPNYVLDCVTNWIEVMAVRRSS